MAVIHVMIARLDTLQNAFNNFRNFRVMVLIQRQRAFDLKNCLIRAGQASANNDEKIPASLFPLAQVGMLLRPGECPGAGLRQVRNGAN